MADVEFLLILNIIRKFKRKYQNYFIEIKIEV